MFESKHDVHDFCMIVLEHRPGMWLWMQVFARVYMVLEVFDPLSDITTNTQNLSCTLVKLIF